MSAYGNIALTSGPVDVLSSTSWDLPPPPLGKPATPFRHLVLHHLRLDSARMLPGLLEYTHRVFAAEVEAGRTCAQEANHATVATTVAASARVGSGVSADTHEYAYTRAAFEACFWAADVFVAIGMMDDAADVAGDGDLWTWRLRVVGGAGRRRLSGLTTSSLITLDDHRMFPYLLQVL